MAMDEVFAGGERGLPARLPAILVAPGTEPFVAGWSGPGRGYPVSFHETGAGRLPVVHLARRDDFVGLVRELLYDGRPELIPGSMGSLLVSRRDEGDRFIIISGGDYSGVPAGEVGLSQEGWTNRSRDLRLAHESCHYLVRRLFPDICFGIQDELVADAAALMDVTASFDKELFLKFMGLGAWPTVHPGGRFCNYVPEADWEAVGELVVAAAENVAHFFSGTGYEVWKKRRTTVVAILTFISIEELAAPSGERKILDLLNCNA